MRSSLQSALPHLGFLAVVLVVNRLARHRGQELSWTIGWNITSLIYAVEGTTVGVIQSFAVPSLTVYFSFMYVYGYVFLTTLPFVAYAVLDDPAPFRRTIVAYSLNYLLGLVCYVLFISYGPRNFIPGAVDSLLYTTRPDVQLLTSTVNANTNVFPSLHSSLSVSVVLLARRTVDSYPRWYALSIPLASSVLVATMYLGIHWTTDVVGGALLAVLCVRVADRYGG